MFKGKAACQILEKGSLKIGPGEIGNFSPCLMTSYDDFMAVNL
jgi:hypothetical protein